MIDVSVVAEDIARLKRIRELLVGARVGDAKYDAGFFALQKWLRYSLPGAEIEPAIRQIEEYRGKDQEDWEALAEDHKSSFKSRLLSIVLVDLDREQARYRGLTESSVADDTGIANEFEFEVFLSYSNVDSQRAERIRGSLVAAGLRCFMAAKDIASGDHWSDVIRKALRSSMEVCVLFSPTSARSEWVLTEWGAAWALGKRIVPILYRTDLSSLPDRLKAVQVIDFSAIDQYVREVRTRLGSPDESLTKGSTGPS